MPPLPMLKLEGYNPATFDISRSSPSPNIDDWIEVFRKSIPTYKQHALRDETLDSSRRQEAVEEFASQFNSLLDTLKADPKAGIEGFAPMPFDCLSLCHYRDSILYRLGFGDIFKTVKERENFQALQLLPDVLAEIDSTGETSASGSPPADKTKVAAIARMELTLRGVFAGNIFDLGAAASAQLFEKGGGASAFEDTRQKLLPRPWAVDNIDEIIAVMRESFASSYYKKALLFVDNAGCDFILGMIPLARELVKAGTEVIIAANEKPTVNDITAAELHSIMTSVAEVDDTIQVAVQDGRLRVMSSGSHLPVIDLRKNISQDLCDACHGVDLVVLEGMGRSIETNLNARFTCDSWKLGMIKHPEVATLLGGRLYDIVCKFDKGTIIRFPGGGPEFVLQ